MQEKQQQQDVKINNRNVIIVGFNSNDRILVGSQPMDVSQIKDKIVEFITNPFNDP